MKHDKFLNGKSFYFNRETVTENPGRLTMEKHYHTNFEIYYITDGECSYFIDNKSYQLIPGDIILIPEGVIHNTEYNSAHSRMLIICSKRFVPASVRAQLPAVNYLYRNRDTLNEINNIFNKIEQEYTNPDGLSEEILSCYTNMLFFIIIRNIESRTIVDGKTTYIEQAINYIQENFSSNITLTEIARKSHVSPEHFSRMFKKETGFSFCEYLNLLRLQKAYTLLRQSNSLSIAKISSECGFNDSNYFSLKFKQMYGSSPKKIQLLCKK